jgi:predicted ATPase
LVTALDGQNGLQAIEQPELHIHPSLQAAIADLFVEAIVTNKHRFIIETHSEHLILRLLRRIRETGTGNAPTNRQLRTDDLSIYYLEQKGGMSRERRIDVDVKGEFIQPWPDDFFEIDFYERFA